MKKEQEFIQVNDIDQDLLTRFIEPYKKHCKYLKKAQFQYPKSSDHGQWLIQGEFSIPDSCYIADTGHFNAVEFNICFNQLCYVLVAYLIQNNLAEAMADWDIETFKRRQLSHCFIAKFKSAFKKPIDAKNFQGTLGITKFVARGNLIMIKNSCSFYDHHGGWAEGEVTIAILNDESQEKVAAGVADSSNQEQKNTVSSY
ncbi:MAG: FcoT family thioesterase [Cyanobacteria bacterium J06621_8]